MQCDKALHDKPGLGRKIIAGVWSQLAILALLTLIAQILHSLHTFDATEGYFRRAVQAQYVKNANDSESLPPINLPEDSIHVLQVSAEQRIKSLEVGGADANKLSRDVIDRVGGVRPIDRCALADLLMSVSVRFAKMSGQHTPLLAIDIDVAPIAKDFAMCEDKMFVALSELRKHVTVIAIVMRRKSSEDRLKRNEFMSKTQCSISQNGETNGLYFASPQFFYYRHSYPLDFPFEADESVASEKLNPLQKGSQIFPSLGNLIGLLLRQQKSNSLPFLCNQASGTLSASCGGMLLQDLLVDSLTDNTIKPLIENPCAQPEFDLDAYHQLAFNWRWLNAMDGGDNRVAEFDDRAEIECSAEGARCVSDDVFRGAALILGVDGGKAYDKYDVPQTLPEPTAGFELHALQALLVRDDDKRLAIHSGFGIVVDFAVGFVFLMLWESMHVLIKAMPLPKLIFLAAKMVGPPAISLMTGYVVLHWISPRVLDFGLWLNPVYVLLGLALHAYWEAVAENFHQIDPDGVHHRAPDFTFGLHALCSHFASSRDGAPQVDSTAGDASTKNKSLIELFLIFATQWGIVICSATSLLNIERGISFIHYRYWELVLLCVVIAGALLKGLRSGWGRKL